METFHLFAEVGSNFWEYRVSSEKCIHGFWWEDLQYYYEYFKSGRNATKALIQKLEISEKKVLLPIYTCSTVIEPFVDEGWQIAYYSLNKDLSINEKSLFQAYEKVHPSIVLFHSYFGLDTLDSSIELIRKMHDSGTIIVEDITQSLFSGHYISFADYYVSSFRKFFAIPDGGILFSKNKLPLFEKESSNPDIAKIAVEAFDAKADYFVNSTVEKKDYFRSKYQELNILISDNVSVSDISPLSLRMFNGIDRMDIQEKRRNNYRYLTENIKNSTNLQKVFSNELGSDTPLYFPIYVPERRKEIQSYLAEKNIYCPVIWPKSSLILDEDEVSKYMYSNMLCIPIDQRYGQEEMARIIKVLNEALAS